MQTFLPYPSFPRTAKHLDQQRLGKQRLEVVQMLRALAGQTKGYANHPVTLAWKGYEGALIFYGIAICDEWLARGYKDSQRGVIKSFTDVFPGRVVMPKWLGRPEVHVAYRGLLLWKNPAHYGAFGWTDEQITKLDYGMFQV